MGRMTTQVLEAINRQIAAEFAASFSYLAMAAWCEHQKFMGAGRWLRLQSAEEHVHALKLFDFVLARNHPVHLTKMDEPKGDFSSVVEVFERALAQEQEVSRQIDTLYETAFNEKAFAAVAELQWFLTEQVEEEKTAREIVAKFHLIRDDPSSLLDMDRELGTRTVIGAPAAATHRN
jgi:ferritin